MSENWLIFSQSTAVMHSLRILQDYMAIHKSYHVPNCQCKILLKSTSLLLDCLSWQTGSKLRSVSTLRHIYIEDANMPASGQTCGTFSIGICRILSWIQNETGSDLDCLRYVCLQSSTSARMSCTPDAMSI